MRAAFVVAQEAFIRDGPDLPAPNGPLRSSNIAEYQGLIMLLEHVHGLEKRNGARGVYLICGDSELVIRQMTGVYRVRQPHLLSLNAHATRLATGLDAEFMPKLSESD